MKKESNTAPITTGEMKELASAIIQAIPNDLPADVAQRFIGDKKRLGKKFRELLFEDNIDVSISISSWKDFYQKFFGIDVDFSGIKIPEKKPGFDRLIIVAQGLTLNQVYGKCAENFPCSRYIDDLDKTIIQNDRDPIKGSYAIWVKDRIEADEELKNLSANDLKEKNIPGITLLERLLYELKYWAETGKHLDIQNWTLCAGSSDSDGDVPRVRWYDASLRVYWSFSDFRLDTLRARAAVS